MCLLALVVVSAATTACATAGRTIPRRVLLTDRVEPFADAATVETALRRDGWRRERAVPSGRAVLEEWTRARDHADQKLGLVFENDQLRAATLFTAPRPTAGAPVDARALFDRFSVELVRRYGQPARESDGYAQWISATGTRVALVRAPGGVIEQYRFPSPPVTLLARQ